MPRAGRGRQCWGRGQPGLVSFNYVPLSFSGLSPLCAAVAAAVDVDICELLLLCWGSNQRKIHQTCSAIAPAGSQFLFPTVVVILVAAGSSKVLAIKYPIRISATTDSIS